MSLVCKLRSASSRMRLAGARIDAVASTGQPGAYAPGEPRALARGGQQTRARARRGRGGLQGLRRVLPHHSENKRQHDNREPGTLCVFSQLTTGSSTPQASHFGSRRSKTSGKAAFLPFICIPKGCQMEKLPCVWHPWRGAERGNGHRFPVVSAALRPPATRLASLRLAVSLEVFRPVFAR